MYPLTEGTYLGDWLKWETDNLHSRDVIKVVSGSDLSTGTVLGKITATGDYGALDLDATDGSQHVAGILINAAHTESAGDALAVALVRDANICASALVWPVGATAEDKAAALTALEALGIVAREEA
jgi:hypothetical protein